MNAEAIPFDSLGHDWERMYREDGEPLLLMKCVLCSKVWGPSQTIQQIGRCRAEVSR